MTAPRPPKGTGKTARLLLGMLLPALPWTLWFNSSQVESKPEGRDWAGHQAVWNERLVHATGAERSTIASVYAESRARVTAQEAKSTGVLTAAALVAGVATLACTGSLPGVVAGAIALFYLASVITSCCLVLFPRQQYVLTLEEAMSATQGTAEMAASATMSEVDSLRRSNLITGAVHSLVVGLVIAFAAILLFAFVRPASNSQVAEPASRTAYVGTRLVTGGFWGSLSRVDTSASSFGIGSQSG
jgi:hypothetical protein